MNILNDLMHTPTDIRPSPIAGTWYPANPELLSTQIDKYIDAAQIAALDADVVAVIAPHAGHIYSGPVAGHAFAALRGLDPNLVAVISPMHHPYPQALISSHHEAYSTPLGAVSIDKDAQAKLDEHLKQLLGFGLALVRRDQEHALEIEIPFLQRVFQPGFQLLPVMVRDQGQKVAEGLGKATAATLRDQDAILVASTDLSHFYPQDVARRYDTYMLKQIENFDPEAVLRAEEEGRGFACGRAAVAAVLWAAMEMGADRVKILDYATSGDVSGDFSQVVGYGAAVVTRRKTS